MNDTVEGSMSKEIIKQVLTKLRLINTFQRIRKLLSLNEYIDNISMECPPGHYYSPIPSTQDLLESNNFGSSTEIVKLNGIDINVEHQLTLLDQFKDYYSDIPFTQQKKTELRYYFDNNYFRWNDGTIYYSFLRHIQPKRVIEIGSGYTSALLLDVNKLFFNNSIDCTFIEPYPDRLYSLINDEDRENAKIYAKKLQDVDRKIFQTLEPGDILFIDSSHVMKFNSDVCLLLFEILPLLKSGVYIHFHDIYYPLD